MRIDQAVINLLKTYFVPRRGDSHIAGDVLPGGTDTYRLGAPTNRWDTLYARQIVADNITGGGSVDNADKVDGFHASATSAPNILLALDGSQAYPNTAYPDALLRDGSRSLTDNLVVTSGKTIDGVDISEHAVNNTHHLGGMAVDDHSQYVHIASARTISAIHTFNPAVATPFILLGGNAQNQLIAGFYANRSLNLDRSVIAGTGLTGGGQLNANITLNAGAGDNIAIDADTISLETPGTLDHQTSNQVATAHTHAVNASYNPGASSSLLKSGASGDLYLSGDFGVDSDTLYVDVSEDSVYINSSILPSRRGALTVHPSVTTQKGFVLEQLDGQVANLLSIFDYSGNDLLIVSPAGDLESGNPNFVSNLTGWQIEHTGDAEFNNVWIRGGLHASVFVADEMHASGGTLAILTASKLANPVTLPDIDDQVTLDIDASLATGLSYFATEDVIRIKAITSLEPGIDIYNLYFGVISVGSKVGDDPGYYPTLTYLLWGFPTATDGTVIPAGTSMVKWGEVGGDPGDYTGGMILTSDLNKAPYMDVFTLPADLEEVDWDTEPIPTPRVRVGNLGGVLGGSADEWGIAFGTDLSDTSLPYGVFSDLRASLHGIAQDWWDSDGNIRGAVDPNASGQDSLFWLGKSGTDKKFEVTGDGLLRLTQAAIGPRSGPIFDDGLLWLPFDGNYRLGGIETNSEYGMFSPSREVGSMNAARGKYSAGLLSGGGTTNQVDNPNFSRSITTGWGGGGTGYFARSTALSYVYVGTGSLNIVAGTSETYKYTETTLAVGNGSTVYAQCRVRTWSGSGTIATLRIYDTSKAAWRDTAYNDVSGAWGFLTTSWTNNTGSTSNVRLYLTNYANDSYQQVRFDAVEMAVGSYPRAYTDGDLPGCTWSGTAGNSNSVRVSPNLEYNITAPSNWTVSCWFTPIATATETTFSARIWEWAGDGDDRIILYQTPGTNVYRILDERNNVNFVADSLTDLSRDVPHHFLLSWDGTDVKWWIDNVEQIKITPTGSYGTTPNVFAVGTDQNGGSAAIGVISDLFVLSHAIGAAEVDAIYNSDNPVVVTDDFSLRVFDFGSGTTSISPHGLFVRASGNVLGANTSNTTLLIGGIATGSGDLVIGENVIGSAALHLDSSEKALKFYADADTNPAVIISSTGLRVVARGSSPSYDELHAFRIVEPDETEIVKMWGYQTGSARAFVINMERINGVDAAMSIGVEGNQDSGQIQIDLWAYLQHTSGGSSAIHNVTIDPEGTQIDQGLAVGKPPFFTHEYGQIIYTGALKPVRNNVTYTGYLFIPLVPPKIHTTSWNGHVKSNGWYTLTLTSSPWYLPSGVKAVTLRLITSNPSPATSYFTSVSDTNAGTRYYGSAYPTVSNFKNDIVVTCPVDSSNRIFVYTSGANANKVWVQITGYYI